MVVGVAPAHCGDDQALVADLVDNTRADEVRDRGGAVVGGARLVIQAVFCFEDLDLDAVLGEEEGQEQA